MSSRSVVVRICLTVTYCLVAAACSDSSGGGPVGADTGDADTSDAEDGVDGAGGEPVDDGDGADIGVIPPNLSEALDCGAGPPPGTGSNGAFQRHEIDLAAFPDAICNDGSVAVLYFRPYAGEANRNRWLINLNGGGGCGSGQTCAERWCWCRNSNVCPAATGTSNFSMANMNSDGPEAMGQGGIFLRGDPEHPNPLANFNQVLLIYCSSDTWTGTRRDVPLEAIHPVTGEPVAYSIHFLGAHILDADMASLRRDGVGELVYTVGGANTVMPDLDDAEQVLFSGDSAGGAGVINNLDRLAELLRANNSACAGGGDCPLEVRGLMDAIVGPDKSRLDYSESPHAAEGLDSYAHYTDYTALGPGAVRGGIEDESCVAWHAANEPGTEHFCADESHVVRHHVTTPFFVRMALIDNLVSGNYVDMGASDPELGPMTVPVFAALLHRELAEFPSLPDTAEEGDAMAQAPGVFGPGCAVHDTIHNTTQVYGTTITPAGGEPLALFDVFAPWYINGEARAVLTESPTREDTVCPPP